MALANSDSASNSKIDLELKKAFQELQLKMIETQQKLKMSDSQIDNQKQLVRRAELTKSELKQLQPATPTYQAIGRMFVRQSLDESVKMLDERMKFHGDKISSLQNHKAYLERNMKEAKDNLTEMIQARKKQTAR